MAIQSPQGERLLADVPPDLRLRTAHAVTADGQVFSGGDAAVVVAGALKGPGWRAIEHVAQALPGPVRATYGLVAEHREHIGRLVSADARAAADAQLAGHARR